MSEGAENKPFSLGAVASLFAEEGGSSSLIRLLIFAAIFIGPAILKAIQESRKKKQELAKKAATFEANEASEAPAAAPAAPEESAEQDEGGREQWERLMRGESEPQVQVAPPPIPQAPRRRVLTETRALTEEPALTDSPALTDTRASELATPGMSYEVSPSYDEQRTQRSKLSRDFAEFAPQEGLASDREGGPAHRIGASPSFAGGEQFQGLATAGAASEVTQREIGAKAQGASAPHSRRVRHGRMARKELLRAVIAAEVLGPPLALRPLESGPTRPLGWT